MDKSSWPIVSKNEIKIINQVLSSNNLNYWTGKNCTRFEKNFSKLFNIKYSISLANGSVGLDIALKALNLKKNSEVIVTPRSYISSVTSVVNQNLKPVFADIDPNSQNIEANTIEKKITKKTKALVVVHLAGMPANMRNIIKIARKNKLKIIEDCSQAHGAMIDNKFVGSFGDISVWSFCNDKILNTLGEGGVVATRKFKYYKKMWSLKDCGKNYLKLRNRKKKTRFRWVHDTEGTNLRMTEVQAAVGSYQLTQLKKWVKMRNLNAKKILNTVHKFKSIKVQKIPKNFYHSYYRLYINLNFDYIKKNFNRDKIIYFLNKKGIFCDVGSCPEIYKEKYIISKKFGLKKSLKFANLIGNSCISFKVHPNIYIKDLNSKMQILKNFLEKITIN